MGVTVRGAKECPEFSGTETKKAPERKAFGRLLTESDSPDQTRVPDSDQKVS